MVEVKTYSAHTTNMYYYYWY